RAAREPQDRRAQHRGRVLVSALTPGVDLAPNLRQSLPGIAFAKPEPTQAPQYPLVNLRLHRVPSVIARPRSAPFLEQPPPRVNVVAPAEQAQVRHSRLTPERVRLSVLQRHEAALLTTPALAVQKRALPAIALPNRADHGARDVARP